MKSGLRRALRGTRPANKVPVRFSQATSDTPWQDWDYEDTRETDVQAMERLGDVFGIIDLISTAVSRVEWRLYRKQRRGNANRYSTADGGSDEREEVLDHPALALINQPNPFMHGKFLRHAVQQHRELTGEGYLIIERGSLGGRAMSIPIGLWYARPDRIDPVPNAKNFLVGYVYTGPDGKQEPLRLDEVIPMLRPNPHDPYHGLGPVQSILVDVDSARYTSEWNRNFFMNGAPPGGVFQFEKNLSDREWDEFVNRWRESHQGVMRAHRVAFVEGGTWTPEAANVKDMDFKNLRDMTADVIRRAWRIHKHMLGDVDDVNRANAETAEETFVRWQVVDRLEDWKLAWNTRLLPMYGPLGADVETDYVDPQPANRQADAEELTSKANAANKLVLAGYDPTDVCRVTGLPPMKFTGLAGMQVPEVMSEPGGDISRGPAGGHDPDDATDPALFTQRWRRLRNEVEDVPGARTPVPDRFVPYTTAHLIESASHDLGHARRHLLQLAQSDTPVEKQFNGEHLHKHLESASDHVARLAEHVRGRYPVEGTELAELELAHPAEHEVDMEHMPGIDMVIGDDKMPQWLLEGSRPFTTRALGQRSLNGVSR